MKVVLGDGLIVPGTMDPKELKSMVKSHLENLGKIPLTGPISYKKRKVHVQVNSAAKTATITQIV